jgi:BASS family bile acid:Na+ symporter
MLCFICPTATAAAVVTRKLNGDVPGITTYIVLINILTAVLVPLMLPLMQSATQTDFWTSFSMIMAKVFPLLITPCIAAWLVRQLLPNLFRRLMKYPDLAFYLWSIALTLAIAVTTKSIINSNMKVGLLFAMAGVSLICCAVQFAAGRFIGGNYRKQDISNNLDTEVRKVTAGQSLGQKNTVFAIWMAYTFMTPETAIIGGLYSIWHNLYNSWQLYRSRKS